MKHIILTAPLDASTWESCRPFVEKALAQVKDFHAQIDIGLWVFRTQECYSVVHELEHLFANRGIRFLSVPHDGPLPCGVSPAAGEALRALGVEVCNVKTTWFPTVTILPRCQSDHGEPSESTDFNSALCSEALSGTSR